MPLTALQKSAILARVKTVLKSFSPPMVVAKEKDDTIELIGDKAVPYGSKKQIIPGMYFAAATIRKDSVAFHFFPVYVDPTAFVRAAPSTMQLLTGKSCIHFRKEEQVNEKELNALLKQGVQAWKKRGYMK